MNINEAPIIVGLDIGTTKIAVIAGRKNEFGKLEVLGFGRSDSNGVQHGQVLNIDHAIKAIHQSLKNCTDSNPELEIKEVYVGIAGHHIKSMQTRGDLVRQDAETEIQRSEIEMLINNQKKTFIPAGDEIIEVIPQDFHVDNIQNIKDPVGYNGVKVGANFHIITGDRNAIKNIKRAIDRSSLTTKDLVLQPLASASAVMTDVDLEAGVAILDIGGGTSDLAIFYDGILKHTAVIPFGGENITNDIRVGLGVLKNQAEALKVQFGSALANETNANAYITIPGLKGMPPKQISVKNLAQIIQARMEEIFDFVIYELKKISLDSRSLYGGLIITGGGSQLRHLIQLAEFKTGFNARIGYPNEHLAPNHIDDLKMPMYATCIGLILKGFNDYENQYIRFLEANPKKVETKADAQKTAKKEAGLLTATPSIALAAAIQVADELPKEPAGPLPPRKLKFWDKFKDNLIDLFKEEDDKMIK
ncbi:cell division protein FtsA [Parasediminibacterium sp. JCM 36343]|uniref:cell division protein FtsA n=1 Tax=Parasediminibacterium sp. JCM 36343 TaxID=3374279 RepID=UPI00397CDADA